MTREEAIAIARNDPEIIVEVLLQMGTRIEDLERKIALLTRDSSNSSKPPSSDGPAAKPKARPPMKSKKRKPGGQPGHKGSNRDLIPTQKADVVILSSRKRVAVAAQISLLTLTIRAASIGDIRSSIFLSPNPRSPSTSFIVFGAHAERKPGRKPQNLLDQVSDHGSLPFWPISRACTE